MIALGTNRQLLPMRWPPRPGHGLGSDICLHNARPGRGLRLADRSASSATGLVQLGTPEEIYLRLVSPFVARFTGIAAEVPVVLAGPPAPLPSAKSRGWGATSWPCACRKRPGSPGHSQTGHRQPSPSAGFGMPHMFVRPSAVHIVAPHEAQLMARVRDVAFCGRGYEHALDNDGTLLTWVFSERR